MSRGRADLADEAIWLGRLVVGALPEEPEPHGLLALMLYCHARREARADAAGAYVPLAEQDPARWSMALIGDAESTLAAAARRLRPGRFQLEAAIQSAHLAPAFGRPAGRLAGRRRAVRRAPRQRAHCRRARQPRRRDRRGGGAGGRARRV